MTQKPGDKLTKHEAIERAESIFRRIGRDVPRVDLVRVFMAKNKDTGRPLYFWSTEVLSPRGGRAFVLVDRGDFEERVVAAVKHYKANRPLVIRGFEITEKDLLDPGFDWKQLDEEEE